MIYKLGMSIYKEFLLLKRDLGGVLTLFVMPLVLIIAVTLIQDTTFKKVNDAKIPIVVDIWALNGLHNECNAA